MTDLKKTARWTGLWYLGMVPTGMLGFSMIRPMLYVPTDAAQTARHCAAPWLADTRTIPASIGEFWMIGYLLSVGIRTPEKATG